MRLALIGCGNIANFHVPAMRAAGFDLVAVAGSVNSTRAPVFAEKFGIKSVYSDPVELLKASSEWDALLLATPAETTIDYLKRVAPTGKPILTEKPVARSHQDIEPVEHFDNVVVAYNRRFYASVDYAKTFIDDRENVVLKLSIPEKRVDPDDNAAFPNRLPDLSYENSVHMYDLANYLAGDVEWNTSIAVKDSEKFSAVVALGMSARGIPVVLDTCFNSPDNFSINIVSGDERVELKPIEIARYYQGMQVIDPTEETPIRTYAPELIEQVVVKEDNHLKPGFPGLAKSFMGFCSGQRDDRIASLSQAKLTLETAQSLLDHFA